MSASGEDKASKESQASGESRFQAAVEAGIDRDYKKAIGILEQLISETDAPPEAYLLLGRSFHSLGDYSHALLAFGDYIRLKPGSPQGYFFAGRTYLVLSLPQKAVPLLTKALNIRKNDPLIMAMLGAAYLKSRHSAKAVEVLESAVETAPENARIYKAYLNALFIRGIKLCRAGDLDLGTQMLRFLLENGVDNPLLRLELGMAFRSMDYYPEALAHFSAAIEYSPRDPLLYWYRASIYMVLNQHEEALNEINYIRSNWGNLPDLPWNSELVDQFMITACMESRQWRMAAESCRIWIRNRGNNAHVQAMYAEALRNLKDYTAAKNHIDRGLELDPDALELWYEYIIIAWESEDWKLLQKALRKSKQLDGEPDFINKFAILYEAKNNDDDEAMIPLIQDAIRTYGPDPDLMYALGERYLKIGLTEEALNWFDKTISIHSEHERAFLGKIAGLEVLANEGMKQGKKNLKLSYIDYLKIWQDNRIIRRDFALFLIHICEYEEASQQLKKLLVYEPGNTSLRRVLAYTYRKTNQYRDAAVLLKGLLKENPKDKNLLLEFAGCLERAGSVHFASSVLEKALLVFKDTADIYLALGMLYYRDKKIEKAFDMLREAAAKDTKNPKPYEWMMEIAKKNGDNQGSSQYEFEANRRKKAAME
jgi:tetratricopeptide (TPR) repeat protein